MSESIEGKTAVVTGSSSGIGKGIARRLALEGANVVVNSRSTVRAEETAKELREEGCKATSIQGDVREYSEVNNLVKKTVGEFGSLDIMINNAGIITITPLLEMSPADWKNEIETNLDSVFYGIKAGGEQMKKQGNGGHIINISSIFGSTGIQGRPAYSAAKGGINNLTRSAAIELAEFNIHVNAIGPGFIRETNLAASNETQEFTEEITETNERGIKWPRYHFDYQEEIQNRTPLGRRGSVEEIAQCVAFLASGGHYITGEIIHADGGWLAFGWGSKAR